MVQKKLKGRPRVSPVSHQMKITISKDDFDMLHALSDYTGTKPAAAVRELIVEARPVFSAMLEALESTKGKSKPVAGSLADKMLKQALKGEDLSQRELFELLNK